MAEENVEIGSSLHHAEVGVPFRVEIEGAVLELSVMPDPGGGKSIHVRVSGLDPSLGFSYTVCAEDGKARSRGGSAPSSTFDSKEEAPASTSQGADS